jgi:hypothetical protein
MELRSNDLFQNNLFLQSYCSAAKLSTLPFQNACGFRVTITLKKDREREKERKKESKREIEREREREREKEVERGRERIK